MAKLTKHLFYLILLTYFTLLSCTQNDKPDDLTLKIDSLFQKWDNDHSAGAAVAIVKDGDLIFKNGYGMANLEYDIPITANSIFYIGLNLMW